MKKFIMALGTAALALCGCSQNKDAGKPAIDLANFDNTVSASEDFYQYACGGWMEANPLTPEYARHRKKGYEQRPTESLKKTCVAYSLSIVYKP